MCYNKNSLMFQLVIMNIYRKQSLRGNQKSLKLYSKEGLVESLTADFGQFFLLYCQHYISGTACSISVLNFEIFQKFPHFFGF